MWRYGGGLLNGLLDVGIANCFHHIIRGLVVNVFGFGNAFCKSWGLLQLMVIRLGVILEF